VLQLQVKLFQLILTAGNTQGAVAVVGHNIGQDSLTGQTEIAGRCRG
jgi:hypothetical protein